MRIWHYSEGMKQVREVTSPRVCTNVKLVVPCSVAPNFPLLLDANYDPGAVGFELFGSVG